MTRVGAASREDPLAQLARLVDAAPRDPLARRNLAVALAKAGRHERALEAYLALLDLTPNDPDAAADAGLMARRIGAEERFVGVVQRVAEANPGHARIWQVLGLMHRALDDLAPAVAALGRAAGLAPGNALIAHGHARAVMESGAPAASLFERAMSSVSGNEEILLGYAAALVAEGRWQDAAAFLEGLVARQPGWIGGQATLARMRWEMGDQDGFTTAIQRGLAAEPGNLLLWRELLTVLIHADRHADVLEAIEAGRKAAGPHIMFDANEAVCLAELGRTAEADQAFAALGPVDDAIVNVQRVRHLIRSGRIEPAVALLEGWTAGPAATMFWPYMATAWRLLGDPRWEWLEGQEALVGIYDLGSALPSLPALADRLRVLHSAVSQPLEQSVRGGTQTDGMLFARTEPEIRALRAAIVDAVSTHIHGLPARDATHPQLACRRDSIRFSGSWSVRLTGQGHHANHVHPAGWFSSAFYVVLPGAEERGGGEAGWLTLGEPQAELGVDLAPFRTVEPRPGRLVLFPSTMWHGTRPIAGGERLTVAFDVAPPV